MGNNFGIAILYSNFDFKNITNMAALTLKEIPEDVLKYILQSQGSIKAERKIGQFSMESTVYKIIREHKELNIKKK